METREDQIQRETRCLRDFQSMADDISLLIVNSDVSWVDIEIQIDRLRNEALRLFPLKRNLFEMVYVSRYRRLWEQWHGR